MTRDSFQAPHRGLITLYCVAGVQAINCLPSFILIGTARSASTTTFDTLKLHPKLLLWETFDEKELNYWNQDAVGARDYAEKLPPIPIGVDAITGARHWLLPHAESGVLL